MSNVPSSVSPGVRKSGEINLHGAIAKEVDIICASGRREVMYIHYRLEQIQGHLYTLKNYGFTEVRPMEGSKLPAVVARISSLVRIGPRTKIRPFMTNLLVSCGIPAAVLAEKKGKKAKKK